MATVGIAFGQNSDITSEASGVVILDSSLEKVDELLHISKRMLKIANEVCKFNGAPMFYLVENEGQDEDLKSQTNL